MKFESHETREKPLNNRTQFLFLTFAILLSGLVFGWFVWQITDSGAASVFLVFGLSFVAWLAVVRSLQKSHQALLLNNAEKEKAEAALRQSEQYRNLFRHANDAILIFEPETEIVLEVNDKACEIYQRRREDFIGRSLLEMSPNAPRETERLQKLINGEAGVAFETVHLRGDGAPIHLTINCALIEYQGRQAILSINRDVTARKKIEEERRASDEHLRSVAQSARDAIISADSRGSIVFWNQEAEKTFGYAEAEIIGKSLQMIMPAVHREAHQTNLERSVATGENRLVGKTVEVQGRRKDGTEFPLELSLGSWESAKGKFFTAVLRDITERKRFEEQLLHDAFHDGLTGLANRALFMDYLQRTIERGKNRHNGFYAVLFLDFDRFKVINDSLGHLEGDRFLKIAAHRLARSTRVGDLVARLGGDEFVVLLSELPDPDEALAIAARIQEDLKEPFEFAGREIFVSASIGIALSTAGHMKAEDLLRDADIAMYRAKSRGGGQSQVFDQSMHEHASKQLSLETEMRRALEREEFELYYQPIINLEEETLMGFEALVRWRHPARGLIAPDEFVPVAEESGLILPLGKWILQESCRRLRRWQTANPEAENLTMSVNLSCKQFAQTDLAGQIARALESASLDPRFLKLEITESHVMENSEQAIEMMNELRALGVEISLDDFGTGYSSLSYLHRLPANFLKIDRSFVMRMTESEEHSEIVQTIIRLAQNLKMKVIAEGIETAGQLAYLKYLKCEFGQGYYFSKPLNADDAKRLIDRMPMPALILEHEQAKSLHKKA